MDAEEYFDEDDLYESEDDVDMGLPEEGDVVNEEEEAGKEEQSDDEWEKAAEWKAAETLPPATWKRVQAAITALLAKGHEDLTVLVVGPPGAGTSSTVNSLLGEAAADVKQAPGSIPPAPASTRVFARRLTDQNFLLRVIDCPPVLSGGTVNIPALDGLAALPASSHIDAVVLVDRLDVFRIQPSDHQMWRSVRHLVGTRLWSKALVCLTHGNTAVPPSATFSDLVNQRTAQLSAALRSHGAPPSLPFCVIDNSSRCPKNRDGEKTLPDEVVWLPALWEQVAERVAASPAAARLRSGAPNPNRKRLWLLPLLLAAQFAAKALLERAIESDSWRGDKNGEFDAETQREMALLSEARQTHAQEAQMMSKPGMSRDDADVV